MRTIDDYVYGHAQAKKILHVLIKRAQERHYKRCVLGEIDAPETLKCLLIGPSGTGKTHLIQSLKKIHKFPLLSLDATHFTPSGNSDGLNAKQLTKLIHDTAHQLTKRPEFHSPEGVLNQLIIFVDEFDKLGTSFDSSGNWNKHVQANFLTLIDNKEEFAGVSWIFAGAFTSLFEEKSSSIGFFPSVSLASKEISDADIVKSGIIPEMLGRIPLIVQLDTFTEADYRRILVERLLLNYNLLLESDAINDIVATAYSSGQGIRSLTRQLEMLAIDEEYERITAENYCGR